MYRDFCWESIVTLLEWENDSAPWIRANTSLKAIICLRISSSPCMFIDRQCWCWCVHSLERATESNRWVSCFSARTEKWLYSHPQWHRWIGKISNGDADNAFGSSEMVIDCVLFYRYDRNSISVHLLFDKHRRVEVYTIRFLSRGPRVNATGCLNRWSHSRCLWSSCLFFLSFLQDLTLSLS